LRSFCKLDGRPGICSNANNAQFYALKLILKGEMPHY